MSLSNTILPSISAPTTFTNANDLISEVTNWLPFSDALSAASVNQQWRSVVFHQHGVYPREALKQEKLVKEHEEARTSAVLEEEFIESFRGSRALHAGVVGTLLATLGLLMMIVTSSTDNNVGQVACFGIGCGVWAIGLVSCLVSYCPDLSFPKSNRVSAEIMRVCEQQNWFLIEYGVVFLLYLIVFGLFVGLGVAWTVYRIEAASPHRAENCVFSYKESSFTYPYVVEVTDGKNWVRDKNIGSQNHELVAFRYVQQVPLSSIPVDYTPHVFKMEFYDIGGLNVNVSSSFTQKITVIFCYYESVGSDTSVHFSGSGNDKVLIIGDAGFDENVQSYTGVPSHVQILKPESKYKERYDDCKPFKLTGRLPTAGRTLSMQPIFPLAANECVSYLFVRKSISALTLQNGRYITAFHGFLLGIPPHNNEREGNIPRLFRHKPSNLSPGGILVLCLFMLLLMFVVPWLPRIYQQYVVKRQVRLFQKEVNVLERFKEQCKEWKEGRGVSSPSVFQSCKI